MKHKISIFAFLFSLLLIQASAQEFDTHFAGGTLRVDYTFSGNSTGEYISLDQMHHSTQWYGRRVNLTNLARLGNGQIAMTDLVTGKCIYKDSFSTLFQEWQTTPEAKKTKRSFENVFLLPYPKNKVKIEILLRRKNGYYKTALSHEVDPKDILIKNSAAQTHHPYTAIHQGGETSRSINVVFVAEGYTSNQMGKFREHAKKACDAILSHQPFADFKNRFNFYAAETPSEESDVSVPRENKWKNTAFGSHFDTFYAARYLTTTNVKTLHNALSGIPYTHIVILANTDVYGGGGIFNTYTLTTTGHPDFSPVAVHEFGHSFAGLADEYYYEGDVFDNTYPRTIEPWEPNITTLVNFKTKWKKLLDTGTPIPTPKELTAQYGVGVFEGAGYSAKAIYRSAIDCRMRTNTSDKFCPACRQAIEEIIKFYTE